MNLRHHDFARQKSPGSPKKIPIGRFLLAALLLFGLYHCWNPAAKKNAREVAPKGLAQASVPPSQTQNSSSSIQSQSSAEDKKKSPTSSDPLEEWSSRQPDSSLAYRIGTYLKRYHPFGGLYLMVDGQSNQPLAWGQWSDSTLQDKADWLNQNTFPAASLIKTVSAAAALESGQYSNHTRIPQIGRYHTLYKRQLDIPHKYSGETLTLEMAYAKSANPPFGIIGQKLGGQYLKDVSEKMGFNLDFKNDHIPRSNFAPPEKGYSLAEAACGFTQENTLNPLLAAAISRAILTDQPLEIPHVKGYDEFPEKALGLPHTPLKSNTYYGLKKMMETTSTHGTSSRLLRKNLFRYVRQRLVIGSKTGTLDGSEPEGRYDWFMGWAYDKENPKKSVVIILMQIHNDKRTLGTSAIAALLLNDWHKYKLSEKDE